MGFNLFGVFFIYLEKIELCKIRADDYSDVDYETAGKRPITFSADTKGLVFLSKKEVLINGKLYDIVKSEINNGKEFYYAFADEEEDEYQSDLTDWEKSNGQEKSLPGKTINLHLVKYFTAKKYTTIIYMHHLVLQGIVVTASDAFLYKSPYKYVFATPPDNFIS